MPVFYEKLPRLLGAMVAMSSLLLLTVGVGSAIAAFGLQKLAVSVRNQDGSVDVQAGSHPYSLTTTFVLEPGEGDLKDARLELPPGLIGNPDATPRCTYQEFAKAEQDEPSCENATAVGVATTYLYGEAGPENAQPFTEPVYNLVPSKGVAAEFGFVAAKDTPVLLASSVRTGTDYGLTTAVSDVNQAALVLASKVTIWGIPAEESHNAIRGECEKVQGGQASVPVYAPGRGLGEGEDELETPSHAESEPGYNSEIDTGLPEPVSVGADCPAGGALVPLLTNPTSCGVPRTASLAIDSWQEPGAFESKLVSMPEIEGCGSLDFSPTVGFSMEKSAGSTPSGLVGDVRVPQEATENPNGLAEGTVRDTTVSLPVGVQVNASSADGLQACTETQIGYTGQAELDPAGEPGMLTAQFTPYLPGSAAAKEAVAAGKAPESEGTLQPGVNFCPEAAKIANVRVKTPDLEGELEGGIYLASPQNFAGIPENPFSSLLAVYLVAEEPKTGVLVKLAGKVTPNEATGQLTTSFQQTPALPFSDLHFEFFGGERASFATPALCNTYQTDVSLTPWSSTTSLERTSSFAVTSGPGGGACSSSPLPFAPAIAADTQNVTAGAFTSLSTSVGREDGQQTLRNVSVSYPPGISAVLTGVPLCPEAQANAGTCSSASQIGEATASAGVGSDPYTVTGGKVYLTEHYDGAPFGVSIVTPAIAGPFNLGNVIVRAKIEVNRLTGAVTVATTGEIPHILDGIPLEIKHVNVTVNRTGFSINPTNCAPMSVTGTVGGGEGASSLVSSPFQVGGCAGLNFQPKVAISTSGHSSKKDGSSLTFKISYPKAPLGTQSWFSEAKFVIPKQLPAQLKTIQQACLATTFETDRAACPAHSIIGHATVHTQLIPEPLTGPVYFVSFGSAKFPDAVMVLNGYGITVELRGETYIHNGITSATFRGTPDVPFESIEVTLPQGEYAEFGTNLGLGKYDFCGHNLKVPTELKAQNGLERNQETPVSVTGCPSTISVESSIVKQRTLTLTVYVPAAGRLTASGKGLPTGSKAATGQQLLTFSLTPKKTSRLSTKIKLTYTPSKGKKQTKSIAISFKK